MVEVAPDARPPVCKLMDYGKFKYEADMKARDARRNQANTILKEIRFRLKIDPHDYGTKKGHVERFLNAGDKVKVMIMFRGREQSRPEMGVRLLERLADDVSELGFIESMPKQDGRNMIMVLGPTKKKADAKNEQRKRTRDAAAPEKPAPAQATAVKAPEEVPVAVAATPTPEAAPTVEAQEPAASATPAAAPKAATPKAPAKAAEPKAAEPKAAAKPAATKPTATKPATKPAPKPTAAKPATKPAPKPTPKSD